MSEYALVNIIFEYFFQYALPSLHDVPRRPLLHDRLATESTGGLIDGYRCLSLLWLPIPAPVIASRFIQYR
jgi:hypothetical protein